MVQQSREKLFLQSTRLVCKGSQTPVEHPGLAEPDGMFRNDTCMLNIVCDIVLGSLTLVALMHPHHAIIVLKMRSVRRTKHQRAFKFYCVAINLNICLHIEQPSLFDPKCTCQQVFPALLSQTKLREGRTLNSRS